MHLRKSAVLCQPIDGYSLKVPHLSNPELHQHLLLIIIDAFKPVLCKFRISLILIVVFDTLQNLPSKCNCSLLKDPSTLCVSFSRET